MKKYYTENIKDELKMSDYVFFDEWYGIVEEILLHPEFQKRKLFAHHHNKSVFEHSVYVSYYSFLYAKYFHASERVCAIAGLLHDFYPKAWLYTPELAELDTSYLSELTKKKPLFKKHGFTHGKEASLNYVKFFPHLEDKRITDAIEKHMFPLTIKPPKYKEGWIITAIDKRNSMLELPSVAVIPKYIGRKIKVILTHKV
ncbi:MAG: phosphohydrolase [Bacilli bacterium]